MTDTSAPHGAKKRPAWTLGDRIRKARTEGGMGQADLAAALNLSEKTIARWESGATQPDADGLVQIAEATQVDPTWLLVGEA